MLVRLDAHTSLLWVLASYSVFSIGFGMVNAPITNSAVSGMPRSQAGVAAAVGVGEQQGDLGEMLVHRGQEVGGVALDLRILPVPGLGAARDAHHHAVDLQLHRRRCRGADPPHALPLGCRHGRRHQLRLDYRRHEHRRGRTLDTALRRLRRVAQLATPGEQLRRSQIVPPRQLADVAATGHLRHQRQLLLHRKGAATTDAGQNLKPADRLRASPEP